MLTRAGNCVLGREEAMQAIVEESWLKQPVWYKLYKTKLVKDISFPTGKCHEDVFWTYQAVARAQHVSVTDRVGYYYLQRSASIMGEGYSLKRLDALEARVRRLEFIEESFPSLESKERTSLLFFCIYSLQMAVRYLPKEEYSIAEERVFGAVQKLQLLKKTEALTAKQRIWARLARCSLTGTCLLRNALKIGL